MTNPNTKAIALGLLAGICIVLAYAAGTNAGPQPPAARVVPTSPQSLVPPSKMIAIGAILHATDNAGVTQPAVNLEPGEVFVLTAVTGRLADSDGSSDQGLRVIRQGAPDGTIVACPKYNPTWGSSFQHLGFSTGIRFARLPNGRADLFLVGRNFEPSGPYIPADIPDVMLHGYITQDY